MKRRKVRRKDDKKGIMRTEERKEGRKGEKDDKE